MAFGWIDEQAELRRRAGLVRTLRSRPADTPLLQPATPEQIRLAEAIRQKNDLFFLRWRAVNGEYIYGRRKEPFGVVNFPAEMARLEEMVRAAEGEIWKLAGASATR